MNTSGNYLVMIYDSVQRWVDFKIFFNHKERLRTSSCSLTKFINQKGCFSLVDQFDYVYDNITRVFNGMGLIKIYLVSSEKDFNKITELTTEYNKTHKIHFEIELWPETHLFSQFELNRNLRNFFSEMVTKVNKSNLGDKVLKELNFCENVYSRLQVVESTKTANNIIDLYFVGPSRANISTVINQFLRKELLPTENLFNHLDRDKVFSIFTATKENQYRIEFSDNGNNVALVWNKSADSFVFENNSINNIKVFLDRIANEKVEKQICSILVEVLDKNKFPNIGKNINIYYPYDSGTSKFSYNIIGYCIDTPDEVDEYFKRNNGNQTITCLINDFAQPLTNEVSYLINKLLSANIENMVANFKHIWFVSIVKDNIENLNYNSVNIYNQLKFEKVKPYDFMRDKILFYLCLNNDNAKEKVFQYNKYGLSRFTTQRIIRDSENAIIQKSKLGNKRAAITVYNGFYALKKELSNYITSYMDTAIEINFCKNLLVYKLKEINLMLNDSWQSCAESKEADFSNMLYAITQKLL